MAKSKPYTLFAADPGESTGVVLVRIDPDFNPRAAVPETFTIQDQDVWSVRQVGIFLDSWVKAANPIVYESWRLYKTHALAMIGNDMQPSQVVGMIRYVAWQHKKRLVSRGARIKKASVASMPDWLTEHMAKSTQQHDQDAIMHAWYEASTRYYKEHA